MNICLDVDWPTPVAAPLAILGLCLIVGSILPGLEIGKYKMPKFSSVRQRIMAGLLGIVIIYSFICDSTENPELDDPSTTNPPNGPDDVKPPRPEPMARKVTVEEYRKFSGEGIKGERPRAPKVNITWDEANNYCKAEYAVLGRLPNENEWRDTFNNRNPETLEPDREWLFGDMCIPHCEPDEVDELSNRMKTIDSYGQIAYTNDRSGGNDIGFRCTEGYPRVLY